MARAKLFNGARMTTATTGTGTITLGSAVSGFLTFAQAGIANGDKVSYSIKDGVQLEMGRGVYTSSGTTLTRSVLKSTNSNSAITLSGAAEVMITALAEDVLGEFIDVSTYGAVGDGSTDDSAAINAAIAAAYAAGIGQVRFLAKEYAIASTITLGNGSASAYSTKNGLSLVGTGGPFLRLGNAGGPLEDNGTRFKWTGSSGSGTKMVSIEGPCAGNDIRHIALNCNDLADHALVMTSANRGRFPYITASDYVVSGLRMTTVTAESIGGQTEYLGNEGNIFDSWRGDGNSGHPTAIGIDLDGYTGSASNGSDSVRNLFNNTYLIVSRAGGTGIRIAFCDQNVFHMTSMSAFGTSNGSEASIRIVGTATVPSAYPFPQNVCFTGHLDIGQVLPIVVSGTPGGGCVAENMTLFDQQVLPSASVAKYLRYDMVENGNFPKGGYWSRGGLNVLERTTRNKFKNARFSKVTAGTSIVNPTSGQALFDGWFIIYDSTATLTVSRQTFTPGQTDVPYEPRHFMRVDVTVRNAAGTYMMIGQTVGTSELLEGRAANLSAWMKANATKTVGGYFTQNFGSGGSTAVNTAGATGSIGTSWDRFTSEITIPSISGKTVGTSDLTNAFILLPANSTFTIDIALPQFEPGRISTAFDDRAQWLDEAYFDGGANRTITAGTGLSGGGTLAADRTISLNLANSNTWTAQQVFASGAGPCLFQYNDDGAGVGPNVTTYRNSASPAANDVIGNFKFSGRDSAANFQDYAQIACTILDPTDGSEDARYDFSTMVAGTMGGRMTLYTGLQIGAPTGGDKGTGTLNATAVYDDNTLLTCMAAASEFFERGAVDLDKWDAMVPDRLVPEVRERVPVMVEVDEPVISMKAGPHGYVSKVLPRKQKKHLEEWVPVHDEHGNGVDAVLEPVYEEKVTPARVVKRRHEVAHLFAAMLKEGFDPRDPRQYLAKLKADEALPGMPTQATWKHNKLSTGEIMSRKWLAMELLAAAFGTLVDEHDALVKRVDALAARVNLI